MLKKTILALVFFGGLLLLGAYSYVASIPKLKPPVIIGEAWAMSDGGSLIASFVDSNGKKFHFGLIGDLQTDPDKFPLFYIRSPNLLPYSYSPALMSDEEKEFVLFLETWFQKSVTPELMTRLELHDFDSYDEKEMEVAIIYGIYEEIRRRNKP